jgi:flagellar motor protein MotB
MTDMMVGLVLIFVILLTYYAITFQSQIKALQDANTARREILEQLSSALKAEELEVIIDVETGILRLPDEILFKSGESDLTSEGKDAVKKVANAMAAILPCYTEGADCQGEMSEFRVDAIFVEGHTDSDPMRGASGNHDLNYDLSLDRAVNTFRALREASPTLRLLRNLPADREGSSPILSLSGYGPDRLINFGVSDSDKEENRRIDLRFLMMTPGALDEDLLTQ